MDVLYRRTRAEGIVHGAPMTCHGVLHRGAPHLLAELSLTPVGAAHEDRFHLHPGKMDAATLVAFGQREDVGAEPFIPFFMEHVRAPLPLRGLLHVSVPAPEEPSASGDLLRNDFTLHDEHGAVLAEFRGVSCKRIREPELITRLPAEVRPESRQAVEALHRLGVKVAMITGDARQVAEAVAADLGIDEVFAEVLPEDKDAAVTDLQGRGHTVAMVGDGVNDAPALARADVGIAIGAGTDVAIESAGIVLASDDPRAVVSVRRLSQASYRKMVQNLWWAAGYNLAAIPLAAGVLAWAGFVLPMAVGAVLMSLSTVIVAINAQFLRRIDLRPEAVPAA
jgi:Cu2+-exporting ATPase